MPAPAAPYTFPPGERTADDDTDREDARFTLFTDVTREAWLDEPHNTNNNPTTTTTTTTRRRRLRYDDRPG
jgi:hypothetical protein